MYCEESGGNCSGTYEKTCRKISSKPYNRSAKMSGLYLVVKIHTVGINVMCPIGGLDSRKL